MMLNRGGLVQRRAPAGTRIRLGNPGSVKENDQYGQLLRFVNVGKDGYQKHPRQGFYRGVDRKNADYARGAAVGFASTGGSYVPADTNNCPSHAPIKGNRGDNGWIYHQPGQQYYGVTNPEECFATAADAEAAGYRAAKV